MRFSILMMLALTGSAIYGQAEEYVTWEVNLNKEETAIEFKVNMAQEWVIYSQHTDPEGPIPLEIEFTEVGDVELEGTIEELTTPIKEMSEMFEVEVIKFKKEADFIQRFKDGSKAGNMKGTITYMTCNSKLGVCYPPTTIEFKIPN